MNVFHAFAAWPHRRRAAMSGCGADGHAWRIHTTDHTPTRDQEP